AAHALPSGTVLDGELLCWRGDKPLPFAQLQRRLGRKSPGASILADAPVRFLAYDLLEKDGEDLRGGSLRARRDAMMQLLLQAPPQIGISLPLTEEDWDALAALREGSRARGVEGVMLKDWESPY